MVRDKNCVRKVLLWTVVKCDKIVPYQLCFFASKNQKKGLWFEIVRLNLSAFRYFWDPKRPDVGAPNNISLRLLHVMFNL